MSIYEEVNVIWHDFLIYHFNTFLLCDKFMQPMEIFSYRSHQNLSSVFCRPYEMVIYVIDTSSCTHPMLLFSHLKIYVWSPLVYVPFDKYGLYPSIEMEGIGPDFALNRFCH